MVTAPEGVTQAEIALAELLICAELGVESLSRRKVTDDGWLNGSVISASRGPIVQLLGLTLGEATDATEHVELATPWRLKLAYRPSAKVRYSLDYVTGWDNETELPASIKQAVLLTASARAINPHGVQSERLGDVSVTYGKTSRTGIPETASMLLGPWRRPRW